MRLATLLMTTLACLPALAGAWPGTPLSTHGDTPSVLPQAAGMHWAPPTLDLDAMAAQLAAHDGSHLRAIAPALSQDVAARAMKAVACAQENGQEVETLLVVDMALAAPRKRLWAFDLADPARPRLIVNARVAHGSGSDPDNDGVAEKFSNQPNSHMTSMGLYRVAERYFGSSGWSRRLDGLFDGFNSKARDRAVVMHPAKYVSARRVGRSQGCPAVNQATMDALERAGLDRAVLWVDAPNPDLARAVDACAAKHARRLAQAAHAPAPATHDWLAAWSAPPLDPMLEMLACRSGAQAWACPRTIARPPTWPVRRGADTMMATLAGAGR